VSVLFNLLAMYCMFCVCLVCFLQSNRTATIAKLETVSSRDLIELSQLLKTMKEREQSLATKLANIQDLVTTMEKQTEHGFQMLLTEDQLLSRIEVLENQLQLYCEVCDMHSSLFKSYCPVCLSVCLYILYYTDLLRHVCNAFFKCYQL
jgi:hypothetical protein